MMNIPRSNPVEGSSGRSHIFLPALTAAILAILISGVGICHARNFLSAVLNSYRDGDNLDRTKVSYMPPGPSGPDQIWDTGYTGILGQYVSGVSVFPDSVIVSTPDAIYYYKENTDSLSLTGYENRKSRISYDTPRLIRPSDMQYGDSVSGYYSGRGSYCGRLDLDISGFQYSVADAYGVIIADGDTIRDVLRVHCHREEALRPHDVSGVADTGVGLPDSIRPQIIEDCWLWFAAGCRYPVMESVDARGSGDIAGGDGIGQTYLFLPFSQAMTLAYDSENVGQRHNMPGVHDIPGNGGDMSDVFPVDADMTLSDDGHTVSISYRQGFKGDVTFVACDVTGRLLCSVTVNGDAGRHDLNMELTRQPTGNVVVVHVEAAGLHDSRKVYKEHV